MKIWNFENFLEESKKPFKRFYLLVKKKYPLDSENLLGRMIGKAREEIFQQVEVTPKNCENLGLEKGVPVLNFSENDDLIAKSLSSGEIEENSLYNLPAETRVVSDKVNFHKAFKGSKYVPNTVFSKEEALELKFPLILKPRVGKSAEGIFRADTPEDLKDADIFSEMIDIKDEYRCFCFKDKIIEIDRRISADDVDFLKNKETVTNFYYKKEKFKDMSSLEKLLEECRKRVKLDFFSVDFATDSRGDLYLIEMNSRTGMGVEKMLELYELVYEDYYGKKFKQNDFTKRLRDEWKSAYNQEKRVDECTIVGGKLEGALFLFKNRDRSYTPENTVVQEKIDGVEVVYYTDQTGWIEGMNEHGVGFVFSQLNSKVYKGYKPSYIVTDEPKNDSKFKRFRKSILKVLTSRNADEAIKRIMSSKKSGSFMVADTQEIYEVEIFKGDRKIRKLNFENQPFHVKTNHGTLIPQAGHQPDGESIKRASSQIRLHQAIQQLQGTQLEEVPSRMKFQVYDQSSPLNVFRTDIEEHTISQCMMDLTNKKFYFFHDTLTADSLSHKNSLKNPTIKVEIKKL